MDQITKDCVAFIGAQFKTLGLKPNNTKRKWTDDLGYAMSTFHIRIPSCGIGLFIDHGVTFFLSPKTGLYYEYQSDWCGRLYLKDDPYARITANSPEWLLSNPNAGIRLHAEIERTVKHYRELKDYSVAHKFLTVAIEDERRKVFHPALEHDRAMVALMLGKSEEALPKLQKYAHLPYYEALLKLTTDEERYAYVEKAILENRITFKKHLPDSP